MALWSGLGSFVWGLIDFLAVCLTHGPDLEWIKGGSGLGLEIDLYTIVSDSFGVNVADSSNIECETVWSPSSSETTSLWSSAWWVCSL